MARPHVKHVDVHFYLHHVNVYEYINKHDIEFHQHVDVHFYHQFLDQYLHFHQHLNLNFNLDLHVDTHDYVDAFDDFSVFDFH